MKKIKVLMINPVSITVLCFKCNQKAKYKIIKYKEGLFSKFYIVTSFYCSKHLPKWAKKKIKKKIKIGEDKK